MIETGYYDFIIFPVMTIGLRQPCTIEDGQRVYCMKYGIKVKSRPR